MSEGNLAARFQARTQANGAGRDQRWVTESPTVQQPVAATEASNEAFWERQLRTWELLGPPLRPSPEDVASYQAIVLACARERGNLHGLILGATPELARLQWGARSRVLAVDRSQAMIDRVWPGHPSPGLGGLCGDWQQLLLPDHSCDVVLGDGSLTQLEFPTGYFGVSQSIRRVLTRRGMAAFRCFVKPATPETPERVLADLWTGCVPSFHVFKWRLAMALQETAEEGVELHAIWSHWADSVDPEKLARHLGWSPKVIATVDNYRGVRARYTFPTLAQLRQVLRQEFVEVRCEFPNYALGDRCPMLTLQPRSNSARAEPQES